MDKNSDYDAVIVGAGIVGSVLAYALLTLKPTLRIALIDQNPAPSSASKSAVEPGFDARSLALNAGTCDLLASLGFWDKIQANAQPIKDIYISDRGSFGALDLHPENKQQAFGYVLELHQIGNAVKRELDKFTQLKRFYDTSITDITKQPEQIVCHLQDKHTLTAKLCIAADGAGSLTRQLLAIPAQRTDYGCTAIIANVRCSEAHLGRAFERFTQFGPIALLPLTNNRYSLVWSAANDDAQRLTTLNDAQFLTELQRAFGYRAGIFIEAGKRATFPLTLLKTCKPFTHRGVCIGNAAHALHPIMGQGFNLGMRDVFVLATIISEQQDPQKIGDFAVLNDYWLAREADHNDTVSLTDTMVRLFSNSSWPIVVGRNLALQAMSYLPDLSAPITKQAKGQFPLFIRDEKK